MSAPAQERQEADGAAQQPAASLSVPPPPPSPPARFAPTARALVSGSGKEPDPSDPDPEIGTEADGAAGADAADAPSASPGIPEGAEGTDTAAEVAPGTTPVPFVALPSISLHSGSGIPSLELCDVITTDTGRTETRRQVEVQPAISYEMVVDIQVARHLQTEVLPPPPPPAGRDHTTSSLFRIGHSVTGMAAASVAASVVPVRPAPSQGSEVREMKGPTSDRKMSVFVPTPSQHQLVTGREPPEDDESLSPSYPPPRPSPQKSLLSRSPRMSPRRGLSRALSGAADHDHHHHHHHHHHDSHRSSERHGGSHGGSHGGDSSPLSLLSTNVFDIDWKLWWAERLRQVDARMQRERQNAEARMMRECLSLTAFSLGAQLLPNLLGVKQTSSGSAASLISIPSTAATAGLSSSFASSLLSGPCRSRLRPPGGPPGPRAVASGGVVSSRASRRVSFSDIGHSLTAQPPSSAHSKPRRFG